MKRISGIILVLLLSIVSTMACEIKFATESTSKEVYNVGEVIIMKMTLTLTHRNCPEGLESTKYSYPGFKVLGATQWKEVNPGVYERKFKLEVEKSENGKSTFSAIRSCHKEGGSGSFSVTVKK